MPQPLSSISKTGLRNDEEMIGLLGLADILRGFEALNIGGSVEQNRRGRRILGRDYSGMFILMACDLSKRKVYEFMSKAPPTIDAEATLLESVGLLLALRVPRLIVVEEERAVGVLREQDLFFEIAKITGELKEQGEGS